MQNYKIIIIRECNTKKGELCSDCQLLSTNDIKQEMGGSELVQWEEIDDSRGPNRIWEFVHNDGTMGYAVQVN